MVKSRATAGRGPGRPRSAESHQAILEAAARLLDAGGMANVTMEGIAQEAGVSKQTLYRWWDSKTAVVLEAITSRTLVIDDVRIPYTDDVREDIATLVMRIAGLIGRDAETISLVQYLISMVAESGSEAESLFTPIMGPIRQVLANRISAYAEAQPEGALGADPVTIAELIGAGIIWRVLLRQPITDEWIRSTLRVIFPITPVPADRDVA